MVDQSIAVRTRLWKIGAVASAVFGAMIAGLPLLIPTGPGDLGPAIGAGLFGVALVLGGALLWRAAGKQGARILDLVFAHPEQIRSVEVIVIKQGAAGVLHAVHVIDTKGKRHGLIVGSLAAAEQMRARIVA